FQAEDGIRDGHVTGVQTCALPISSAFPPSQRRSLRRLVVRDRALAWREGGGAGGEPVHGLSGGEPALRGNTCGGGANGANALGGIGRASCRERVESGV